MAFRVEAFQNRHLGPGQQRVDAILTVTAGDLALDAGTGHAPAPSKDATATPAEQVAPPPGGSLRDAVQSLEHRLVRQAMERHHGNWASAARELQMDRANLIRLARRLGLYEVRKRGTPR